MNIELGLLLLQVFLFICQVIFGIIGIKKSSEKFVLASHVCGFFVVGIMVIILTF